MVDFLHFTSSEVGELDREDLSYEAISTILLGTPEISSPPLPQDSPAWAKFFIAREYQACQSIFAALDQRIQECHHPGTGELAHFKFSFIPSIYSSMTLPVFRVFGKLDSDMNEFCLVYCGILSRVTHIVFPSASCVIYDLDRSNAPFAWEAYTTFKQTGNADLRQLPRVGVVDMVSSYAHQAMNHLSGLQRLIDSGKSAALDEIWVSGREFFGRTEDIFPELSTKIRHVAPAEVAKQGCRGDKDFLKIGSNFVTQSLRERLACLPARHSYLSIIAESRWPLLAITVRSKNRRCLNLADAVERIVASLLPKYPNLGVVLDGWVFPETEIIAESNLATAIAEANLSLIRDEIELCNIMAARLPHGVLVCNLVGSSVVESIKALSKVQVYFAHVGTLQHKIGWFTDAQGLVHGPVTELARLESSYYSSVGKHVPRFLNKDLISDVPTYPQGIPQCDDYRILDCNAIVSELDELISSLKQWDQELAFCTTA